MNLTRTPNPNPPTLTSNPIPNQLTASMVMHEPLETEVSAGLAFKT